MPAPLPKEVRDRFARQIVEGVTRRDATRRLQVSAATGGRWVGLQGVAVLVAGKAHGMTQEMPDAGLELGLGVGRFDGEALEAVHDRNGDVLDAAVVRGVETLGPDLRALIGPKPQPQDVPGPIWQDG